jgi:S-adenosylmethionine:tRNA ribosyltransferase-isomerase
MNACAHGVVNETTRLAFEFRADLGEDVWYLNVIPYRAPSPGDRIVFSDRLAATVLGAHPTADLWRVEIEVVGTLERVLDDIGRPIMSPYIERVFDNEHYNTVYATTPGSSEMPAAGRHFTNELLEKLQRRGVRVAFVTLSTGLSYPTITEQAVEDHEMLEEWYSVPAATASAVTATKEAGHKVWVVGTTVMRALESAANGSGHVRAGESWTSLYVYPGYAFKVADAFVTNFHGPRSTRIAMAAAFTGPDLLMKGYQQAMAARLTFYEFGDATLTL